MIKAGNNAGVMRFNRIIFEIVGLARKFGFTFREEDDPRVRKLQETVRRLGGIQFRVEHEISGEWTAVSTNTKGIITGGSNYPQDVNDMILDAIFTYFEIPPRLCKPSLLHRQGEVAKVEERVYA